MKIRLDFLMTLQIVFVVAKLWNRLNWNWISVFSPLAIEFVLLLIVAIYQSLKKIKNKEDSDFLDSLESLYKENELLKE